MGPRSAKVPGPRFTRCFPDALTSRDQLNRQGFTP
jgi:hypothetical protein